MSSDDRHEAVEAARRGADLSIQQLWLRYVALGGSGDAFDIDGYLQGLMSLQVFQQDMLAQAVNEALEDLFRSLQVPLSAIAGDGTANDDLTDLIDELLAHRRGTPHPLAPPSNGAPRGEAPAGDAAQRPARRPGTQPGR